MKRAKKKPPFRVTPVYDKLLWGTKDMPVGLYPLHLATAEQLCRLHYKPGSIKSVKARLKTLVDEGYIFADTIPTKNFKAPYFYGLTRKGARYLTSIGVGSPLTNKPGDGGGSHALFVEHALELNDVIISAFLVGRADSRFWLAEFTDERTLKHKPWQAEWEHKGRKHKLQIIPDAYVGFARADGARLPVIVEHDRGTEQQLYFRKRIRAYISLFEQNGQEALFGSITATVAFTTFAGKKRLLQMLIWTWKELEESGASQLASQFCFAALTKPLTPEHTWLSPIWYTAVERMPMALLAA